MTPTLSGVLYCIGNRARKITNPVNLGHTHIGGGAIHETGLDREDLERNTLGRDHQLELIV